MFKRILTSVSVSSVALAVAATIFTAGAGTAMAPEADRLNANSPLAASSNAWAYAIYVNSQAPTYGFYLSNTWQPNYYYRAYTGYPCSRFAQPAGTTLKGYIMTSGISSRCSEY